MDQRPPPPPLLLRYVWDRRAAKMDMASSSPGFSLSQAVACFLEAIALYMQNPTLRGYFLPPHVIRHLGADAQPSGPNDRDGGGRRARDPATQDRH